MDAFARIVACADRSGVTVLTVLRGEPPLLPRRTGPAGCPIAEVHLVSGAAGPLGGDRLRLEVEVGSGAALVLRTVAATVALPGPSGETSSTVVSVRVAAGGRFAWLPEPLVAAANCDHRSESIVEVAEDAQLLWRDEVVAGRHGEAPGRLRQATRVRWAGTTVLNQELELGPVSEWAGPAVLGGARVTGNLVVVSPLCDPPVGAAAVDGAARMPLAGPVVLCTGVADSVPALRCTLADLAPAAWWPTN
jgi:urease accessory protein